MYNIARSGLLVSSRFVNMKLVQCVVFIVIALSCLVFGQETCITPTGNDGVCILIKDCKALRDKIKKTAQERETIRQWQCGFEGEVSKVCCQSETPLISILSTTKSTTTITTTTATTTKKPPKTAEDARCVTRFGTIGVCIRIQECPKLLMMMANSTKQNLDFIQRSRCPGRGFSVCCDEVVPLNRIQNSQNCPNSVTPPAPDKNCCGVESPSGNKIIGGTQTSIDQYPWLVLIDYNRPYSCGGTLISSLYVLTAAHCLVTSDKKPRGAKSVVLGEYNRTNSGPDCVEVEGGGEDCTEGISTILIEKIIPHENYNSEKHIFQANDIGLIKLREMAPYSDFIRPLCLPTSDITQNHPSNWRLHVAGWGAINDYGISSNIKLHTDIPYVEQPQCRDRYKTNGNSTIWDKQLCAGGEVGKDTCRGDSGGPLINEYEQFHEIIGIISYGPSQCGAKSWPSIYTKVYDYLEWITVNIET